jgi:hypothetical protein
MKRLAAHARTVGPLLLAAGLAAALLLAGCRPAETTEAPGEEKPTFTSPGWFEDVTDAVGLDFVHDAGPVDEAYFMPQIVGSGAALFDFDGDGLLDIYLLQNAGPDSKSTNRLYKQLKDGTFRDVSAGSGLDVAGWNMGVAVGDVNNDGLPDVLLTQYGGVRLFLNNGDGTFTDATREAGLDVARWAASASFVDYDRDGWLDLCVTCYVDYDRTKRCTNPAGIGKDFCAPKAFAGSPSLLFHNLRRPGPAPAKGAAPVRFEDVSVKSGIGKKLGPGLGVIAGDFDGDGWPDLFVANDGQPNHLWMNQRDGTFKEEAAVRGVAYNAMGKAEASMGVGWGDLDGDGLFDVFVTHLNEETNTLWRQESRGHFKDVTAFSNLARPKWRGTGFGALLGDFDQDGALDVAIVNGRVFKSSRLNEKENGPFFSQYADRNQLFRNDGKGKFTDASLENAPFCATPRVCRGLAMGDVNGDGALDLLVTQINGRARLYRNVASPRGHWLLVRAVDPELHRDAYGAEVTVRAGDRRWVRQVTADGGYLTAIDPRAHFGLGSVDHIDEIGVRWPNGDLAVESFAGGAVDRVVKLEKGTSRQTK